MNNQPKMVINNISKYCDKEYYNNFTLKDLFKLTFSFYSSIFRCLLYFGDNKGDILYALLTELLPLKTY